MTIRQRARRRFGAGVALTIFAVAAHAKLNDDELKELGWEGTPRTPVGAIRAANADGSIPEWAGGITTPPAGYQPGKPWVDPYADDKPLFTITAQNYQQYQDKLTPGQQAMFKQYPDSFRMHVYPTRRSATYPEWMLERTIAQAKTVEICPEYATNGIICLVNTQPGGGVPFPIFKTPEELGWNTLVGNFRGQAIVASSNGALVDSLGNRTDVIIDTRELWPWWLTKEEMPQNEWFTRSGGAILCDSWQILQPPRSSGLVFGGCDYTKAVDFQVYLYIPGQRRVRKAPEIGFHDSPSFGSDGQRTAASRWMWFFGGQEPRHSYTHGQRELFLPYNSYKIVQDDVKFDDIFGKRHINQDLIRYELRRAWMIDSKLKAGQRHLYKRHVAYFDEDTYNGLAYEAYDGRDRLWRVGEQYVLNLYDSRTSRAMGDSQIDLINGRYTTFPYWHVQAGKATGFGLPKIQEVGASDLDISIFTPQGLRKFGTR